MERSTPVRKTHTSTADLLAWSENPPPNSSSIDHATPGSRPGIRTNQPAGGISKVLFGGQMTEEEAESLNKRKPCSGLKWKEMTGSGIFAGDGENEADESGNALSNPNNRTGLKMYQQAVNAMSQISFSAEESVSPKKATSIAEVAKLRELTGTLESETDSKMKQLSDAKCKELSGHDIFGPPPEILPRPLAGRTLEKGSEDEEPTPRNIRTSVKVSNPAGGQSNILFSEETPIKTAKKVYNQKVAELTGNDIFKGEAPPGSAEKPLSVAKLREMSGSDIFADGKAASRDYWGGVRKPPGGESSIALV